MVLRPPPSRSFPFPSPREQQCVESGIRWVGVSKLRRRVHVCHQSILYQKILNWLNQTLRTNTIRVGYCRRSDTRWCGQFYSTSLVSCLSAIFRCVISKLFDTVYFYDVVLTQPCTLYILLLSHSECLFQRLPSSYFLKREFCTVIFGNTAAAATGEFYMCIAALIFLSASPHNVNCGGCQNAARRVNQGGLLSRYTV